MASPRIYSEVKNSDRAPAASENSEERRDGAAMALSVDFVSFNALVQVPSQASAAFSKESSWAHGSKLTMCLMNFKTSCAFSKVAYLDCAVSSKPTLPVDRLSTRLKIVPTFVFQTPRYKEMGVQLAGS